MAETIISPGVFTQENDLSFLPAGIGAIGAAVVGPTVKGPAFVPTLIRRGFKEYIDYFGDQNPETYIPFTVKEYLRNAGSVTVVRVLAGGGYYYGGGGNHVNAIVNHTRTEIISVIAPSKQAAGSSADLGKSTLVKAADGNAEPELSSLCVLTLSGSSIAGTPISCSFQQANNAYILKTLGDSSYNSKNAANSYDAGGAGTKPAWCYINFRTGSATGDEIRLRSGSNISYFGSTKTEGYDHAKTPFITSGFINAGGSTVNLFKFHTLADGTSTNKDFKVSISQQREHSDIDGVEQYSTFTIQIRNYNDTDRTPTVLEQYNNVNLNPDSPNYISRVIGDRWQAYDTTFGKVRTYGDYPNISRLIRVEVAEGIKGGSYSPKYNPKGFVKVDDTILNIVEASATYKMPHYPTSSQQTISNNYNIKSYMGWDFTNTDAKNWNNPVPTSTNSAGSTTSNKGRDFNLDRLSMHPSASATYEGSLSASIDLTGTAGPRPKDLKFSLPFQGGVDGLDPAIIKKTGEYIANNNVYGFDLSTTAKTGYSAYKKAIDILSNQDEYDINMLALPGVIKNVHSAVTDYAVNMVEDRGDTFYIMDLSLETSTVSDAVNDAAGLNSNYAGAYYPWVKILDTSRNKPVFVPPSVIVPGAIAASDRIGAEWFAPAGLNRGILGTVLEAKNRLTQAERDELYEGRVNPIATFPATGVCIWGQKTLQVRPTALDRINVRRLLITVKKFIASSSKYLVFEQNTVQTRNRFLNIVNPYLESVQQRQGLFAFRVQMDEGNNTPDVIDRNQLVGAIYLQPAKTAEFIILDFNVLPTGATFPS